MALFVKNYIPTLPTRPSEMKGLEFLPGANKNRITPCFLLSPWLSSKFLERTIQKIEAAFPSRPYFLDIDLNYQTTNLEVEAQRQFVDLLNPEKEFNNWVNFIANYKFAWPVIQLRDQNKAQIIRQIEKFQQLDKKYCLRILSQNIPKNLEQIIEAFNEQGAADYVIILEGGWIKNPLLLAVSFTNTIKQYLIKIESKIPIAISCTSMPKNYGGYEGIEKIPFTNRDLIDRVANQSNLSDVLYADWASTRPREIRMGGSQPINRIDYPTDNAWYVARNKKKNWNFEEAATELIENDIWSGELGIWGEEMIIDTALGLESGINTYQKNSASRINIHLYLQSLLESKEEFDSMPSEDEWED